MSAIRKIGQYKISAKYEPNRTKYTPWVIGDYRVTIRQPGTRHNLEEHRIIIWREPSNAGYGYAPEQLGLTAKALGTPKAYDAIIRAAITELHERWPNRTLFKDLYDGLHGMRRA